MLHSRDPFKFISQFYKSLPSYLQGIFEYYSDVMGHIGCNVNRLHSQNFQQLWKEKL